MQLQSTYTYLTWLSYLTTLNNFKKQRLAKHRQNINREIGRPMRLARASWHAQQTTKFQKNN